MTLFGAAIVLVNHLNVSTHLHSPAYNEVFAYTRSCRGAPSKYSYTSICMLHTHKHTFSTHTSIAGIAKCANWLTVELLINRITLWLVSYGEFSKTLSRWRVYSPHQASSLPIVVVVVCLLMLKLLLILVYIRVYMCAPMRTYELQISMKSHSVRMNN